MTDKEYIELFHRAQVNLVAFKPVFHCDDELRRMVEMAIEDEREACAKVCEEVMQRYKTDTALDPDLNKVGAMSAELCALWIRKWGKT